MKFLAEDNNAGQVLLRIVSRGNALIAELLRLGDVVPDIYINPSPAHRAVILDFSYIAESDRCEHVIRSSNDLMDLDSEIRETHLSMLTRFYQLFDGAYKYVQDVISYVEDLEEGVFVQLDTASVLDNSDGKQLLVESVYLWGVMLLLFDQHIPGVIRERLLIAYYRYEGASQVASMDELFPLFRRTEYVRDSAVGAPTKHPSNYPEKYFARVSLPDRMLRMLVGRLRTDDIYGAVASYPLPEHRSTALAPQAAMLYVLLFFMPKVLKEESAVMREIVDKHFNDNWVIAYYLGYVVDLQATWKPYKAARDALSTTITSNHMQNLVRENWTRVPEVVNSLENFLRPGVLTEEFVLARVSKLLATTRDANVTLRWLMLHIYAEDKKAKSTIKSLGITREGLIRLMMSGSQFEFQLNSVFKEVLATKEARWGELRTSCKARMLELAEYFSGTKVLERENKSEKLQKWFTQIADKIGTLDVSDSLVAGRKMKSLILALSDVTEFHQIEQSLQVKAFIGETKEFLQQMLRTINASDRVVVTLAVVSDMAYGWYSVREYISGIQGLIKANPRSTLLLRATLNKLGKVLGVPLVRINQAGSKDLESVSEYFSGTLVKFVRKVLEVIPRSVFVLLREIILIQTSKMNAVPTRADKDKMDLYALPEERFRLAKLTNDVSVFATAILDMGKTLVGVIEMDPRALLDTGIRQELDRQVAVALDESLVFSPKTLASKQGAAHFVRQIRDAGSRLKGIREAMEYIQDYVSLHSLRIWQEESARVFNYNGEQECNPFLRVRVSDTASRFQSDVCRIPAFAPKDRTSVNFMGRLLRALLTLTTPSTTVYVDSLGAWYDSNTSAEVASQKTFQLLESAVGVVGLRGLDALIQFMIAQTLQSLIAAVGKVPPKVANGWELMMRARRVSHLEPSKLEGVFSQGISASERFLNSILPLVQQIGQMQLLRRSVAEKLASCARLDSGHLTNAVSGLSKAVVGDVRDHFRRPEECPYPLPENYLLSEITEYQGAIGEIDALQKIYVTCEPLPVLPAAMAALAISHSKGMTHNPLIGTLSGGKGSTRVDGTPLALGILTLLKHFHAQYLDSFAETYGTYLKAVVGCTFVSGKSTTKTKELPVRTRGNLLFLEELTKHGVLTPEAVEPHLPPFIVHAFGTSNARS